MSFGQITASKTPKRIFLVRHGESEGNIGLYYQNEESSLTDKGVRQAELLAERLSKVPIDTIVLSPIVRAEQTASILAKRIHKPVILSFLFEGRRRPSV